MITAITGHRPENIIDEAWTREAMSQALQEMGSTSIIQGMAAGVDLWSAATAWRLGLPYESARPWATHSARIANAVAYEWVLSHSEKVTNISEATSYPGNSIYHTRNMYMVNNADNVLAVWNGLPHGGTFHAVQYALQQEKKIFRINPTTKVIDGWIN